MSYIYLNLRAESEEKLTEGLAAAGLSDHQDIVILGTLYEPPVDPEGLPTPIPGFHANIALADPALAALLEPITVHPKTPIVGWYL